MKVISVREQVALCQNGHQVEEVSLALVGPVKDGQNLLVYLGSAIRLLDPVEAQQIADALQALDLAASGQDFEHLIADLIDREPQLPPHLQRQAAGEGAAKPTQKQPLKDA